VLGPIIRSKPQQIPCRRINAVFPPFQPEAILPESLSAASVHAGTLIKGLEGALVPGASETDALEFQRMLELHARYTESWPPADR
jgi:hypothetical protein